MKILRNFGLLGVILFCFSFCNACMKSQPSSPDQFRDAMDRHDFELAERLWNQGVRPPATNAYTQFMQIKDRLQAMKGVKVTNWKVEKLQTIDGTNRYSGVFDIEDAAARFGIGLKWEGQRWALINDHPEIPSYVRQSVTGSGSSSK